MFPLDRRKDRIRTWQQSIGILAGQESQECFFFISNVEIRGIYLSLTLGNAKILNKINQVLLFKKKYLST